MTGACDASTGIEQASGRSIDMGINHDLTQSARTMPTPPLKTHHYRADIRKMCRAKLQAGSRRPAERIRLTDKREVTVDIMLRMLMHA